MKRFTVLIALAAFTGVYAQEENPTVPEIPEPVSVTQDTSTVRVNGKRIIIISDTKVEEKKEKTNTRVVSIFSTRRNRVWEGFEIGFTGVSYTSDFNTSIPAGLEYFDPIESNSINWAINPFELDVRIINEYVKFSTGLGYMAKNFTLANNYLLTKDPDGITRGYQDHTRTLVRNRFRTGYITAPAMLYFNTDKDPSRAFRVGAGVVGGVKIFEAYRLKHYQNGHKTREKYNGGYNANPFMLDLRAVVGYGGMNLYATYSTQGLFDSGKGPEVYPFTIGIAFVNSY
tara:strand:+ start:111241 stop:112098 length:858 start_codon:yes stop_codon:yes gene_type:complete